ncbi:MAG: carboxylesterase/lipase family protein [Micromonosporaceae bacterium]|nr:carboxylesterase/lipase family protein [Micromonosporaceae bacterium]
MLDSGNDPVAVTRFGAVRGAWRGSATPRSAAFLGIPYAQAPMGELRFAAPRPPAPWQGERDGKHPGPTAQRFPFAEVTTIPEPSTPGDEVLNLNVFTPAPGDPEALLPVLVWIHGGGYFAGCQNSPWYDGAAFNRDGIVTVSIGYRLGVEGWLHVDGAPDNRGALDWLAALRWVQENIQAFGGDPSRVAVAGQSAGGGAVLTLLSMPASTGLFHRALAMSGAIGAFGSTAEAATLSGEFTALTGLPATVEAMSSMSVEALDAATRGLVAANKEITRLRLAPFVDGDVIPYPPLEAFGRGIGADVSLVLGFTRDEFNFLGASTAPDLPDQALRAVLVGLGMRPDAAAQVVAHHHGRAGEVVGQAITDVTFRCTGSQVADRRVRAASGGAARTSPAAGGAARTSPVATLERPAATWLYEFDWAPASGRMPGLACHCDDLPFWWDGLDREGVAAAIGPRPPQRLADRMHQAAVAFVTSGDPGWARYNLEHRSVQIWDEIPELRLDPLHDLRRQWEGPGA